MRPLPLRFIAGRQALIDRNMPLRLVRDAPRPNPRPSCPRAWPPGRCRHWRRGCRCRHALDAPPRPCAAMSAELGDVGRRRPTPAAGRLDLIDRTSARLGLMARDHQHLARPCSRTHGRCPCRSLAGAGDDDGTACDRSQHVHILPWPAGFVPVRFRCQANLLEILLGQPATALGIGCAQALREIGLGMRADPGHQQEAPIHDEGRDLRPSSSPRAVAHLVIARSQD